MVFQHPAKRFMLLFLIGLPWAMPAGELSASFHLWRITEVYSNNDGSEQFIELAVCCDGENFIANRDVVTHRDGGQNEQRFTFPGDVTGDTGSRHLLLATGPVAGVEPDFVIPPGFVPIGFQTSGTVDISSWAFDGSPNIVTYDFIPNDGFRSIDGHGTIQDPATVTNFSGNSATLEPPETEPDHYSLSVGSTEGGSVAIDPNNATHPEGAEVTLTALANSGYVFTNWIGDVAGDENPLTLVMDADKTIQADFAILAAPNADGLAAMVVGAELLAFQFLSSTRFRLVDENGDWSYERTGPETGILTFVYDGESPDVYREEVELHFVTPDSGDFQFTVYEGGTASEDAEGAFDFDFDFFQLPRTPDTNERDSFWFGRFDDEHFVHETTLGWIAHEEHGWLYAGGRGASESLWLWDHIQQDWLWTRAEIYPFFFSDTKQNWLYYSRGGDPDSRDFFDYRGNVNDWIKVGP